MHRNATAKPSTEGTAPSQRQGATPIASTRKSNHDGSNQNHSAKKEVPTASEAAVASHCLGVFRCEAPACPDVISSSVTANGESVTEFPIEFRRVVLLRLTRGSGAGYIFFMASCGKGFPRPYS